MNNENVGILKQIEELSEKGNKYDRLMEKMSTMQHLMNDIRENLDKIDEFINPTKILKSSNNRGRGSVNYNEKCLRIYEEMKLGKQFTSKNIASMFPELSDTQLGTFINQFMPKLKGYSKVRRDGRMWYFIDDKKV